MYTIYCFRTLPAAAWLLTLDKDISLQDQHTNCTAYLRSGPRACHRICMPVCLRRTHQLFKSRLQRQRLRQHRKSLIIAFYLFASLYKQSKQSTTIAVKIFQLTLVGDISSSFCGSRIRSARFGSRVCIPTVLGRN